MRPGWITRRCLRLLGENQMLRHRVGLLERQNDHLSNVLQQTRRDSDLLCLMTRDPKAALEFIRTMHDIDGFETTREAG